MERVSKIWKKPVSGSPFFVWEEKLRSLKSVLKSWVKNIPSSAKERKKAQAALDTHQARMEEVEIERESLIVEEEL